MQVIVITPDETLFSGEAKLISLPGSDGSFAMLNKHAPIISTLTAGTIKIVDKIDQVYNISIKNGVVEMNFNKASVLVEKS